MKKGRKSVVIYHRKDICLFFRCQLFIDFQSKGNVFIDIPPFEQMVMLEHVTDSRLLVMRVFRIKSNIAGFRLQQSGNEGENR